MIFIEWYLTLRDFYRGVVHNKDKLNKADVFTDFVLGFIYFCITLFIPIIAIYLIVRPIDFIRENSKNLSWQFIWENINWAIVTILVIDLIFLLSLFLTKARIKKIKEIEDFLSQRFNTKLNTIYSELLTTKSLINYDYEASFNYFSKWFKKQKTYADFIKSFKETTEIKIIKLDEITKVAKDSLNGKFSCVISYDEYFKDTRNVRQMVRYFASFYESINKRHNKIERIFTLPGKKNDDLNLYQTEFNDDKKFYTLLYLIINKVCLVDTFLFIYNKNSTDLDDKFFLKSDYVIAYPSSKEHNHNNTNRFEIELFFAYPKENSDDEEKALRTKDTFFVQIFEMEYRNRLKLLPEDESVTTFLGFNTYNYDNILSMLGINKTTDKTKVNEEIEKLQDYISQDKNITKEVSKTLSKKIKRWKLY